jgi:ADP-heptose:LPS heptosyltransferase
MPSGPFPILFFAPAEPEEAMFVTGVFKRLHDEIGNASFTVVAGPRSAALFRDAPKREATIVDEGRGMGEALGLWGRLRHRRWGLILDAAGRKLSGNLPGRRRVRTSEMEPVEGHKVVQAARLLKLAEEPPAPYLFVSDETDRRAEQILGEGGPLLAMAPCASWIGRTWPVERYARLAARLLDEAPLQDGRLLIVGEAEDRKAAETLRRTIPRDRWIDLTSERDPLTVHACLKRVRLYVGGAVVFTQMAAAAGAPTLALFGPDDESLVGPWGPCVRVVRGPRSAKAIEAVDPHRDQPVCHMLDLPVESVIDAARGLLKDTADMETSEHG